MPGGEICVDDPRAPDVRALLALHLTFARAQTPPENAHAIDVDGLLDPAVTFFGYRAGGKLLAVGALRRLDCDHAEIKSMHTSSRAKTAREARRSRAGTRPIRTSSPRDPRPGSGWSRDRSGRSYRTAC